MSVSNHQNEVLMDMNATPLIDVMLVLLIMFIITVPIMTHSTQLLTPGVQGAARPETVSVSIEYGGDVTVNGKVMEMGELEAFFRSASARSPQPVIKVQSSDRAKYETFAQVLAIAQRNGMQRITLGG